MSAKVTRKATSARKVAKGQANARRAKAAKAKTGSMIGNALAMLPFSEEQLQRMAIAGILGGAALLAWFAASAAGVPAMVQAEFARVAAAGGFKVHRVEVRGVKQLNELKVYERALAQRERAMTQVDIEGLREQLLELSWVEDARVSRQLPDTLVIDVVERKPVAVLRKPDRLVLIDATGHELEKVSEERAKGKLMLSGPAANKRIGALGKLLDAAPAVKPQLREAAWVGNRRWNLTFKTGQILALPEGERQSAHALMTFARLDGANRLIGGKVATFDMRTAGRIYLRVPGRSEDSSPAPGKTNRSEEKN
ncbi:MAG: cell division protein FtsQ/DivIB [Novosphingobium sp.]